VKSAKKIVLKDLRLQLIVTLRMLAGTDTHIPGIFCIQGLTACSCHLAKNPEM